MIIRNFAWFPQNAFYHRRLVGTIKSFVSVYCFRYYDYINLTPEKIKKLLSCKNRIKIQDTILYDEN